MQITVIKNDHRGREVWRYHGTLLERGPTWIKLEAFFSRPDVVTDYHIFRQGDRFIEWFYSDRWYNIFEMYSQVDGRLVGWYCNITRPAIIERDVVRADDLALDVFVMPGGALTVLDEDEFEALPLDPATRQAARDALAELRTMIATGSPPFESLRG